MRNAGVFELFSTREADNRFLNVLLAEIVRRGAILEFF